MEWATLLGALPVYMLWYPFQQPSGIVLAAVAILFVTKKVACLYIVHGRIKEIEEEEEWWRIRDASEKDSFNSKGLPV